MDFGNLIVNLFDGETKGLPMDILHDLPGSPSQWAGLLMTQGDVQEMRALLNQPLVRDSSTAAVFLPGIMGSLLGSTAGIGGLLWLNGTVIAGGSINLLDLDETGEQDASPDVSIVPVGLEKSTYVKAVLRLSRTCCLYEFPYDWRRRLETSAAQLATAIERWSAARPHQRFTLIGHSMGGLLARTFVVLYPELAERVVERIVLLASPLYGAAAVPQIFTGETMQVQLIKSLSEKNDVVRMCASFPTCYELLPPPPALFPSGTAYPFDWDLYDARDWNIPALRQDLLDEAAVFHRMILGADPQVETWQFAGCNLKTVVGLSRILGKDQDEEKHAFSPISMSVGETSGDGTVPLWSARGKAVHHMHYVQAGHQTIPSDKAVLDDVVRLLHGEKLTLPSVVPLPLPERHENAYVGTLTNMVNDIQHSLRRGGLSVLDMRNLLFRGDIVE